MKDIFLTLAKKQNYLRNFLILLAFYNAIIIGISWDENYYKILGEINLKYLFSLGQIDTDYYSKFRYSTIYWSLTSLLSQVSPNEFKDEAFHIINTFFGLGVLIGLYKVSKKIFNLNIAKISVVFLLLTPFYFGHLAINNKDIILALCHIWILYYCLKYNSKNYSFKERAKICFKIALFAAIGTGIQLLFIGSLITVILFFVYDYIFIKKRIIKKLLIDFIIFCVLFYLLLILFWVDVHNNIFILPFEFFVKSLSLEVGWPFNVLNGEYFSSSKPPSSYIVKNILYKLPEFLIFLYLVFILILFFDFRNTSKKFLNFKYNFLLILSVMVLPNIVLVLIHYPIYDGLRLFLWSLPYYIFIPSIALNTIFINFKDIKYKVSMILFSILFIFHLYNFLSITPYQYTYLNFLTGVPEERYKKFENDYWSVSLKELILNSNIKENKTIKYTSCGVNPEIAKIYMKKKYKNTEYSKIENSKYIIMTNRTIYSDKDNKITNCYDRFNFKNLEIVQRNGLVLSTIKEINK